MAGGDGDLLDYWITKGTSPVRITEFESPPFSEGMFLNIPEGAEEFESIDLREYQAKVRELRAAKSE